MYVIMLQLLQFLKAPPGFLCSVDCFLSNCFILLQGASIKRVVMEILNGDFPNSTYGLAEGNGL